jgi:hypothetical protein
MEKKTTMRQAFFEASVENVLDLPSLPARDRLATAEPLEIKLHRTRVEFSG